MHSGLLGKPSAAELPSAGSRASWFCFLCKARSDHDSIRQARAAWKKHSKATGHDTGWVSERARWPGSPQPKEAEPCQ